MKPRNRVGERSDFVTSRDARLKNPLTGREPRGRRTAKQPQFERFIAALLGAVRNGSFLMAIVRTARFL